MNERHRLIAVILDRREVTSQQQLVELLAEQGVAVTQATVSRDLDRLGAVRVRRNGHMVYALPEGDEPIDPQELLRQVLGAVLSIESSSNLCILKTKPAQAMPVARAFDQADLT
jgi:transcriptional regulator of arginine metabolism